MKYSTFVLLLLLSSLGYAQVSLPIDFESATLDYELTDFGGNMSSIEVDPTDPNNMVGKAIKTAGAQLWAGTTMAENGLAAPIPFTVDSTKMSVRVWSPDANVPIRLKVEDATDPTISVETEALTTMAGAWETLEFDFNMQAPGTAAINLANAYTKASIFFNFGTDGAMAGEKTYYWDDVMMIAGASGPMLAQADLPLTYEDTATVDYALVDFGGNVSEIVVDPTNPNNLVGKAVKQVSAQLWAGTTTGGNGLATAIPFTANDTKMSMRIWSPDANTPIRLKVEDAANPAISVETEVMTTMAGAWETLEFDFAMPVAGTAAINLANTYNKASIFFNFGTDGATAGEKTYYWDDVMFVTGGGGPTLTQVSLPITFEDTTTVDYALVDFGGNVSEIVVDPTDPNNLVGKVVKLGDAQLWAGTTNGGNGLMMAVPFTGDSTKMSVRIWSPDANTPIRVKVEDATNGAISVETEAMTTMAGAWETLEFDFSMEAAGTAALNLANTYDKLSIFFNFGTDGATAGEKTYYWDDVMMIAGGGGPMLAQADLPLTYEDTATVDYALVDFGGNVSEIVVDPTDPNNLVGKAVKLGDAQVWAGTTSGDNGLANPIPFTADDTKMSIRIWSPDANIPIRLKVEDANDPTISVETEAMTTMAGAWETLEFDFTMEVAGTAALNLANTYNKASIFFNFGTDGATAGEKTYYWDDVMFVTGGGGPMLEQVSLPITFEDTATVDYNLVDFGGNVSEIVVDPTDPNNLVGKATKLGDAQLWAGTTNGDNGLQTAIPFTGDSTRMSVRVWSPDANIPIRLKVEDATDPTISVETEAMTTMAGAWETLEFDFSMQAAGTAALNLANTYDKVSIFFNFGTDGATAGEKTYYWDDVMMTAGGGGPMLDQVSLPITFEDTATVDYALVDFGGNVSEVVVDPTDPNNLVGKAIKLADAQLWAGTTNGGNGLLMAVPFTSDSTKMSVRVWSPDANTPIRLKVEDNTDGAISVETEVMTTMAGAWETLEFDFSMNVAGTPALNLANTYDKVSIFFNFGTDGATAGEKTYYWDDVMMIAGGGGPVLDQVDLPITFEDTMNVDYALVDFGGNVSDIVVDPTDPTNTVGQAIKLGDAQVWAGTTNGGSGLANAIPFNSSDTKMTVRVWSPDAGTPILLKVEDATDPTISVETLVSTTMAGVWETLEFDFSMEAAGTAALDLTKTYDKVSIFFNFGTDGATAGEKTYYWDDIMFGELVGIQTISASEAGIIIAPNPASDFFNIEFPEALNGPVNLQWFDANGRLVKTEKVASQTTTLSVDDLNEGMFYLRIENNNQAYYHKMVIVR